MMPVFSLVDYTTNKLAPEVIPRVFSGARVTRSLAVYVCFVDRCVSMMHTFWSLRMKV
jgi:hypothetical protein